MGGRATPDDDPCKDKAHQKRRRQKKDKRRSHSKSKNRRRYDSCSPSSSSSLSLSSSSSPSSYSSDSDSDSKSGRVRARNKDERSRRRREKHGSARKKDRSGRKRDRPSTSRRVKVVSKRRKLDSSSKPRHETERGRQRKRAHDKYVSASRSPSSSRSCSTCDSRSSSSSRSRSRHGRRRKATIEGTRNETQGAGKSDNRVEITQEFDDLSYSHSYNSDDGVKKLDNQDAKLPSPSSRKIASLDLATDNDLGKQPEHSSEDGGCSHHTSVPVKVQGCRADDYSQSQSNMAGDAVTKLKSMVVAPASVSKDNDLELVLRQRALENLRKFKSGNAYTTGPSICVADGQVQNRPDSSSFGISQLKVKDDRPKPENPTQYTVTKRASLSEKGATSAAQQKHTFPLEKNITGGISPLGPVGNSVGKEPIQTSVSTAIGGMSRKLRHTNSSYRPASTLNDNVRCLPSGPTSVRKEGLGSSNLFSSEPERSNQCLLRQKKQNLIERLRKDPSMNLLAMEWRLM